MNEIPSLLNNTQVKKEFNTLFQHYHTKDFQRVICMGYIPYLDNHLRQMMETIIKHLMSRESF